MKILPYLLALIEPQPPHVCSIVKLTMQEPDGGGGTRHRLDSDAVERITARVGASAGGDGGQDGQNTGTAPGTAAAAAEGDGGASSSSSSTSAPASNGASSAAAPAASSEPAAPPTPTLNPPVGQDPLQSAIQLERSSRELERARAELRAEREQLRQMREAARDPFKLLEQNGHNVVDVVQTWLGPAEGAEGGQAGQPGQGQQRPGARPQQGGTDPVIAELREEIRQLKERDQQQDNGARRAQRLDGVKRLVAGTGDALGVTTALGLEGNALSVIEQIEQQNGVPMGPAETLQTLHHYERQTRENVINQIQSLAKLSWAGEIMRKALGLGAAGKQDPAPAASAVPAPTPATSRRENTPPDAPHTGNGSNADALASTVTRSREERLSTQELRARSRAKVAEILEKRREGLG